MAVRFSRWIAVVTVVSVGGVLVAALVGDPEVSPGDGRSPAATGSPERGPGDMPSFGDELTEEQIIAVVEFTRSDG
jgi:mono/diheme cytochrome c family protein